MNLFSDRVDAGKQLASAIAPLVSGDAVILAIPRGGVVVGFEVAKALDLQLDIIIPRKIGAPGNPELAIGAVTEDGTVVLNQDIVNYLKVPEAHIREEIENQRREIARRLKIYRANAPPYPSLKNRPVIIVDDGIATGATMKAALASARNRGAKTIIMAVPVGPASTLKEMEKSADHVVCLQTPETFYAIGQFYEDFAQTTDEEVINLLKVSYQKRRMTK